MEGTTDGHAAEDDRVISTEGAGATHSIRGETAKQDTSLAAHCHRATRSRPPSAPSHLQRLHHIRQK